TIGSPELAHSAPPEPNEARQDRRGHLAERPSDGNAGLHFRCAHLKWQAHSLQECAVSRRILVVDDEQGIRAALGQLLEFEGYEVHTVANATDGIAEYQKWRPHLVFLDVKMAGMDGMEALKRLRELDPSATVVMISGHATIRTAVEATQAGAYEILEKPLDTDRILVMLRNALSHLDLQEENARLKQSIEATYEIVGKTPVMRALMEKIEKV